MVAAFCAVKQRVVDRAPHPLICAYAPFDNGNCPAGYADITFNPKKYIDKHRCGSYLGCAGRSMPWTDSECNCNCQPRNCAVLVKDSKECPVRALKKCPPGWLLNRNRTLMCFKRCRPAHVLSRIVGGGVGHFVCVCVCLCVCV